MQGTRVEIMPDYRVQGANSKRNSGPALPEDDTHMPKHVEVHATD